MQVAFLVPVKGLLVRDPGTKEPIPVNGITKTMVGPEGRYWRRRIKDESVKISKQSSIIAKVEKQKIEKSKERKEG